MKQLDRVRLIRERAAYTQAGVKAGDTGIVMGENRCGYCLVYFDGEIVLRDGIYQTTEIDLAVREEDLALLEE